jgi:hypothetical protein
MALLLLSCKEHIKYPEWQVTPYYSLMKTDQIALEYFISQMKTHRDRLDSIPKKKKVASGTHIRGKSIGLGFKEFNYNENDVYYDKNHRSWDSLEELHYHFSDTVPFTTKEVKNKRVIGSRLTTNELHLYDTTTYFKRYDTIPCFILVSDTSTYDYSEIFPLHYDSEKKDWVRDSVEHNRIINQQVWQVKGYETGNSYTGWDCGNCLPKWHHHEYLDENKKPLQKEMAVWMKL